MKIVGTIYHNKIYLSILGAVLVLGGQCVYWIIQYLVTPRFDFENSWDKAIPFIPEMVFAYFLLYPFIVATALLVSKDHFLPLAMACGFSCVIGWSIFLILPASLDRPDPYSINNRVLRAIFVFLHFADSTTNTFPSLHVALAWTCALGFYKVPLKWIMIPIAIFITASTVLIKQHLVWDVAGGFVLAVISWSAALYWQSKVHTTINRLLQIEESYGT